MKFFELFRHPTLEQAVEQELLEARHEMLMAENSLDKARCLVEYNRARIARLTSHHVSPTMGRAGTPAVPPLRSGTPIRADIAPGPASVSGTRQTEPLDVDVTEAKEWRDTQTKMAFGAAEMQPAMNAWGYIPNKGWGK